MIFSGGFGFAGAGKIKPASGETINLVWNGTVWTIEGSSTYWQDATDTEITSDIPNGDVNDLLALCTLNGEVTLTLEADLTISTLFVFGGYPCTINLDGNQLEITDTLYLGSSYDNRTDGTDIDRGTIENDKTSDEDNRLGNLTLSGGDGSNLIVKNVNTSTWDWGKTKDRDGNLVKSNSLTINNSVALSVTTWDTGRIGDKGNGATETEVEVKGGTVEIEKITGKNWELVDGLYSVFENVTGVTLPTRPLGWIGTVSTEWDVGKNWARENVPNENTETVYITKTDNQPVISSEVKLTGKIELEDGAQLTIAEGGSLSIDANNITFGTGSSIVVDGTLNLKLTEDFTVGSNFAKESKGLISCTDSFNLIVDTDFEGPINFDCTKNVTLQNNKTVSFGTIKANTFTNKGTTTVNSNLSVGTVTNNGTLTINEDSEIKNFSNNGSAIVNDSKTLKITKKFNNAGTFSGKLKLSGSDLEQDIQLAVGTNSVYETIEIDSSEKYINFTGNPKIKKLKVVSAKSVSFYYNPDCLISEIEDNGSAIDYNFVYLSFQDFDNASSDDITFNTKGTINLRGIKSSKNIIVNNGTLQINETFEGQDVISKLQTSINGTVNANDINCGKTTIAGNVTAKKITLAENTIDGIITGTEITLGKTKLKGSITGTDVEIGDVELNGAIIGNNITLAEITVVENSELKINEAATEGKITLNGNVISEDAKNLTLNGNIIVSEQCSSINLNQGTLESNETFIAQKDLEINAVSIFGKIVDAKENLTINGTSTFSQTVEVGKNLVITGESVFKDAVKAGENLKITGNAAFESTEKSVEVGNDFTINGNANFANTVTTGNNLTITGDSNFLQNVVVGNIATLQGNVEFLGTFSITQDTGYLLLNGTGNQDVKLNSNDIYKNIIVEKTSGNVEINNVATIENFENSTAGTTTFNAASTITNYTNTKGNSIFKDVSKITSYTNESGKTTFEKDAEIAKLINKDTLEFGEKITSTESVENNGTITINGEVEIQTLENSKTVEVNGSSKIITLKNISETSEVQFNQIGNVETLENKGKVFVNENVSAKNVENQGKITIAEGKIFAISGTLTDNNEIGGDGTIKINGTENQNVTLTTKENIGYKNIVVEKESGDVEINNVAIIENFENATEGTTIFNAAAIITNYTNTKGISILKDISNITTLKNATENAEVKINAATTFDLIENAGLVEINENSTTKSLKNTKKIHIAEGKSLTILENIEDSGELGGTGALRFTGNAEQSITLKENANYPHIVVDKDGGKITFTNVMTVGLFETEKSPETVFENKMIFTDLKIQNGTKNLFKNEVEITSFEIATASETKFESNVSVGIFTDKADSGIYIFNKNASFAIETIFNTTETVSFGSEENSTITFGTTDNYVSFTHTAGMTLITGNLSANDVTLGETSINGTVNANDINCGNTTIAGNVVAKKITLAENTIDGTITGTEITLGKTKLNGNITGTDVEIGDLSLNGTIAADNITLAEITVVENSELKINEAATEGNITLKGNVTSTDSKTLTLNGNVDTLCSSINLNQGILESKGTFTAQNDLEINAVSVFGKTVDAKENLTINGTLAFNQTVEVGKNLVITGESVFKDAVKAGENLKITGNAAFESTEKSVEVGNDFTINGNANFANTVTTGNNLTIEGDEIIINGAAIAGKSEPFTEGSILLTGITKITANSLSATKDITLNANVIETADLIAKNITIQGTTIKTAALIATENIFINKDFEVLEQTLNITGDVSSNNFEAVAKTQTFDGTISVTNDFISKGESLIFAKAVAVKNDFILEGETFVFSDTITVDNDFSCKGTQLNFAKAVTVKYMNLSGDEITFADKVTVNQNAQIQNTGLLKISDFVYGKSFVQKGIGQVMISGSFEQSGESENPTATFGSNVYFYNSSQNSLDITIGSDKSSITINGNLVIAKSKGDKVSIKGTVISNNFALYSGNVDLFGNLEIDEDVVILGENYSLKDNQTGIENLYSYNKNRPAHWSQASYTFETSLPDGTEILQNYAGTVKVVQDKSITVGKNLYANGTVFALSGALGSGKWKLNVPDTSVAANAFCEVYNSEVSDCDAAYQIAALQCTDKSGNINWAFDDETGTVKITKAYSVSDNVIRVEFNKPVRILKDRFTQKQMRFSNGPDENHYFENVYLDEKCTTEASEVVNQYYEENGSKNYFVYVKANSKWNTDATGTFVGEEKSTDYDGVHQNTTICLDFPRAITTTTGVLSYIITDLWGKRLTNYSARTTSGTQKIPFEDVEDKTGPVLISVKTGQENHTEYDAAKGAQSQPSYDSHNFIEFVYSEFVNFGSENSNGEEEVFLKADDQGIENAKNIQVTQKFGALQNEDITQSGELKFAGLAKIQNGKIYTGSQNNQGNADKYVNALYRFDKYSLRYSVAGYTHPTEFVQDAQGNNHKKWIGYIEEAELPTGTVSMICDGKNDLVFDMAGNSQTLVKNNLTVDSSKYGVYGNWDISKPIFAPLRMNETQPWKDNEYIEAIGNNKGFGDTLDRVEFHLFDNTPNFDFTDEAVWITERGWCRNNSSNRASLIFDDSYCADIFGGSRAFDYNKENRTAGGIRFSSLENAVNAFRYTTKTDTNPSEKFDVNSEIVIGANARLFTGNSDVYRDASVMDGLYFSLLLNDKSLNVKTTFKLSYDDKIGYITDLAGNRLKSKTAFSVDRTPPSIESVLSPIDNKTFYIIFTKKLNLSKILLLDNDLNEIEISESFLELLPQCFELITINDDGTFVASDIQIDSKIAAEPVSVLDNGNYTAFKMAFTRDVSLEDVKNVYLRVVNPKKYDYKMCDPITNIKDSYVTLIQDDLGNYIDMFQTHAISEVAINGINPLYGYNSSIQEDKKPITSTTQDEVSFVVRDWNENQQNYGTFYHDKDITIVCDVDNASKSENNFVENVNLYFNNDTENKMTSEQFNKKIGGNLRIWFPNIMENHFDFFTYNKNASYGIICSERVDEDDISAGLKFEFPKSVVENWKSENQISYLFSYLNEDNSQVNIYPAPKYNLLTGLYELNNSMKFPLFAIRMKDVNDITSLDLWSFKVKSVTNQRGGVTILNNVINATYGEKAIVKINLPQDGNLDVMVMTLDGNIVTYLNHGATTSGEHYFTWNGTNNAGSKVARGLYFVRVISSTIDETRKIMVVKD